MREKPKVAFYSRDAEYRERFERCWVRHYKSLYDFYTFESVADLVSSTQSVFDGMILDVSSYADEEIFKENTQKIVFLCEDEARGKDTENIVWEHKYQEIYKIHDTLQRLIGHFKLTTRPHSKYKVIGVFSLGAEDAQTPFAGMAASEYAQKKRTVMINLQPYSGWDMQGDECTSHLSMEDFILSIQTENYSKSRMLGAVGHEDMWDYVYSVKNTECLAEIVEDTYNKMLHLLTQELGYEVIIINFGMVFLGMHSLMNVCEKLYLLTYKREAEGCREVNFITELEQKGYEELIKRIVKIEVPHTNVLNPSYRQIIQQWRWGPVGDEVRKNLWME